MSQYVVMGVSGCGKSTVAEQLAAKTGGEYLDADDFHPLSNKAKMAAGVPLTDDDRWPWLDLLNRELHKREEAGTCLFLACSALRQVYRERLAAGFTDLHFIFLKGSEELIRSRMDARLNHYMPATLLASQFATLEEPTDALVADISDPIPVIIDKLLPHIPCSHQP